MKDIFRVQGQPASDMGRHGLEEHPGAVKHIAFEGNGIGGDVPATLAGQAVDNAENGGDSAHDQRQTQQVRPRKCTGAAIMQGAAGEHGVRRTHRQAWSEKSRGRDAAPAGGSSSKLARALGRGDDGLDGC